MSRREAVICLGSNIQPEKNIQKALAELRKKFHLKKESGFRFTKPLLYEDQPDFLNGAVLIDTELNQEKLKAELKKIERLLGRMPAVTRNGPRVIDLDIILFNGQIVDSDYYEREFLQQFVDELMEG